MRKRKKSRKRIRRNIALILALTVLASGLTAFVFTHFVGEDSRLIQDGGKTDGRLRVLLKSLGMQKSLTLTLDGIYTVESDPGFRFARGSVLTVAEKSGRLWLDCAGVTLDMGERFTLTRHAAEDGSPNGIYIAEAAQNNIYNGDICLQISEGSISALLYIDIEEYLYGVVPYEMSDSWPLEALKAQAVAARTYALGRKSARVSDAYDLVDTAGDQVFKGYNADLTNAVLAVNSTKGIVGMYKGSFATCYYGASNGGQTAMPDEIWGREGDYDYLDVRDDPYDLENPQSVVRTIDIAADGTDLDPHLSALLKASLSEKITSMGYSEDANDIRIVRIDNIVPCNPKGREGSRMAQTLRFALTVEARPWLNPTALTQSATMEPELTDAAAEITPVPANPAASSGTSSERILGDFELLDAPLDVDVGLYDQIKATFENMDINSSDCELYTVVRITSDGKEQPISMTVPSPLPSANAEKAVSEAETIGYRLEARRYGHGVGMSQRGAQTMAGQHGLTYMDILQFYYPKMDLVRYTIPEMELISLDELPEGMGVARVTEITPNPTPAPLPPLKEGEVYGTVVLGAVSSTLNVRSEPSTASAILSTLIDGQQVIVSETLEEWYHIRTAETEGYVFGEYLQVN